MTLKMPLLLAAWLVLFASSPAVAQRAHVGIHGGFNFDSEDGLIGAQLLLPVGRLVEFYPSFDYYFTDAGSLVGFNVDLKLRNPGRRSVVYAGGGLSILSASGGGASSANTGGNLFLGLETRLGITHPYFEARVLLHDQSSVQLVGGLNLTLF